MKHALVVAFHYPPEASSSGVLRTLKFTRYLEAYGWRVSVLTVNSSAYAIVDPALASQIPARARVIRTRYMNTKKHLSLWGKYPAVLAVPDNWIGWYPWAVRAGDKIIKEDRPQVIYSTSPHATSHLIARRLARQSGIPWVADFRDPWYEEPPEKGTPAIVHWAARRLESAVVQGASHIVSTTDALQRSLLDRYPTAAPGKFSTINNGYDEADFAALPLTVHPPGSALVITHAGSINAEFRDPRPLWEAYRVAIDEGHIQAGAMLFRFIGAGEFSKSPEITTYLSEYNMQTSVAFLPRTPYAEALTLQAEADLLLLLQASDDTEGLVPAKLYEYLRCMSPVLALAPAGASQKIIEEMGGGWAVDPANNHQLKNVLIEIYNLWKGGKLKEKTASLDSLQRYDRKVLTQKLAEIFDSLAMGEHIQR